VSDIRSFITSGNGKMNLEAHEMHEMENRKYNVRMYIFLSHDLLLISSTFRLFFLTRCA